jgi:putative FmdB family regulatory protein
MPVYDYECPTCGLQRDIWAGMDEEEKLCGCMSRMKRIISPPNRGRFSINPDFVPYWDENLGKDSIYVKSRSHRREFMAQRGLVDYSTSKSRQVWV